MRSLAIVVLCFAAWMDLASAAGPAQWRDCAAAQNPGRSIAACTAIADDTAAISPGPINSPTLSIRSISYRANSVRRAQSAERNNDISATYGARARAYLKAGQALKGLLDAERAIALDPGNYRAWDTLGAIHDALGNKDAAVAAYRKASSLNPEFETTCEFG